MGNFLSKYDNKSFTLRKPPPNSGYLPKISNGIPKKCQIF